MINTDSGREDCREEEQQFTEYVRNYDLQDGQIALKVRHTWKVTRIADAIADALDLDETEKKLVHLAALFHDIGRFEQVRRWHTFLDSKSTDHAGLGARILEEGSFLDNLNPEERQTVIDAVRLHSIFRLPEDLPARTMRIAKILRDADKIDIFRVRAEDAPEDTVGASAREIAAMTMSDEVYEALVEHRGILREQRKNALDIWVSFLGFFADMNYPVSFALCRSQGYWKAPFSLPFENEKTAAQIENLLTLYEKYIDMQADRT